MTPSCFTSVHASSDSPLWRLLEVQYRGNKKTGNSSLFLIYGPMLTFPKEWGRKKSVGVHKQQPKTIYFSFRLFHVVLSCIPCIFSIRIWHHRCYAACALFLSLLIWATFFERHYGNSSSTSLLLWAANNRMLSNPTIHTLYVPVCVSSIILSYLVGRACWARWHWTSWTHTDTHTHAQPSVVETRSLCQAQ